jgi:hypothetical protein
MYLSGMRDAHETNFNDGNMGAEPFSSGKLTVICECVIVDPGGVPTGVQTLSCKDRGLDEKSGIDGHEAEDGCVLIEFCCMQKHLTVRVQIKDCRIHTSLLKIWCTGAAAVVLYLALEVKARLQGKAEPPNGAAQCLESLDSFCNGDMRTASGRATSVAGRPVVCCQC